jgi:hypothetical protein
MLLDRSYVVGTVLSVTDMAAWVDSQLGVTTKKYPIAQ